jgi:outer membrane murein-binding lipoprotein Lpp
MSTRVVERVDEWDEGPFQDGYRELQTLADRDFSGVVKSGGAELFMTKGTAVGIRNGSIEDFERAEGTRYEAPTPALPLLAVMQERSDEVRAQYYSEETAINEVDRTLEDGGFTGFIELSENVLSGDYYVVYHQGHSMSVAFVGNTERLLTEDEAFERADGEVGIYEVRPVEIEPIEIPEPEPEPESGQPAATPGEPTDDNSTTGPEATASGTTAVEDDGSGEAGTDEPVKPAEDIEMGETPTETVESQSDQSPPAETADEQESGATSPAPEASQEETETDDSEAESTDSPEDGRSDHRQSGASTNQESDRTDRRDVTAETGQANTRPAPETDGTEANQRTDPGSERTAGEPARREQPRGRDGSTSRQQESSSGSPTSATRRSSVAESESLKMQAVPSLDPDRTRTVERVDDPHVETPTETPQRPTEPDRHGEPSDTAPDQTAQRSPTEEGGKPPAGDKSQESTRSEAQTVDTDRVAELESKLDEREAEIDRLEAELEGATEETEQLQAELDELRGERDTLQAEVDQLESELERLETEFGAATDTEQRMTPREALDGTDIFVRYHSKGDATLAKAHGTGTRRSDVEENLRLEKHTQFEVESVAVGGQRFAEFIESSMAYQFVQWAIKDLLFEIRDTGHEEELKTLYNALPDVDRAELNGAVNVTYTEDGQETRTTETFDVVLRDRMGNPLLVANLNDSREAASESMMERLITSAEHVGQSSDDLAAAFLVTRSFFEPPALETASEATRGGILNRGKQKSFVNLSRKRGYHLCLVEARNQNFHLAVPEL